VENALGLSGGQAILMTITIGITILGLVGLALALFMEKRWKLTYGIEYMFIAALLVMAWYGDFASTNIYTAYQEEPIRKICAITKRFPARLSKTRTGTRNLTGF